LPRRRSPPIVPQRGNAACHKVLQKVTIVASNFHDAAVTAQLESLTQWIAVMPRTLTETVRVRREPHVLAENEQALAADLHAQRAIRLHRIQLLRRHVCPARWRSIEADEDLSETPSAEAASDRLHVRAAAWYVDGRTACLDHREADTHRQASCGEVVGCSVGRCAQALSWQSRQVDSDCRACVTGSCADVHVTPEMRSSQTNPRGQQSGPIALDAPHSAPCRVLDGVRVRGCH
jgi:hypothetical protein